MAILVVGGAGYIGSHTARRLRDRGYDVLIYDNLSTGDEALARGFDLLVGDIADPQKLSTILPRVEAILHFAALAYVGESVLNPRKYFDNNVQAGLVLLNAAVDAGIKHFVFSSSCAVYGSPEKIPIAEDTPRVPINPYGKSKLFFEHALEAYDRAYGIRFASLRYFNPAGADESGTLGEIHNPETHLIPLALAAAAGTGEKLCVYGGDYQTPDGTCIRDYIHVNDLAEAHVRALEYLQTGRASVALNLGTGHGHSIRQILAEISAVTGKAIPHSIGPRRGGDPPVLISDPTRAEELLRWKAHRSLREIISTAWRWSQRARGFA
jgi:UDP-glucose-4-epimerase GalE